MIGCPSCGQENPETARFCNACGSKLEGTSPGDREERKVVSVLFADLVGFTSLAEQMDPEDVREMLRGYHGRLDEWHWSIAGLRPTSRCAGARPKGRHATRAATRSLTIERLVRP
jgi:hypothetical protein